ncbi:MAG: hypothetical protein KBT45_06255 [Bacteroidales bacterium]|nr:hypothetical protein [Candidatus Colimorpha pelethequi]
MNNVFMIRAIQFDTTSGDTAKLNEIVKCDSPVAVECWADRDSWEYTDFLETAPQIQVPNSSDDFELFYYVTDARVYDEDGNESFVEGWADDSGVLADFDVFCGAGVWLRGYKNGTENVGDTVFTFAGQVLADDSGDISGENMFKVRGMPFPVAQFINSSKCDWSNLTPVECWADRDTWEYTDFLDTAPQIQIINASGDYELYYYVSDARSYDEDGNEIFVQGWADDSGMLLTDDNDSAYAQPGDGVWFNARKAGVSCSISL